MNTRRRARVALAYSGGLNGSVAVPWLAAAHDVDVVTMTLDLGQHEELEGVRDRALATGAVRAHVLDAREELACGTIAQALEADALAADRWPLVSALASPVLASKLVEIARIEQVTLVAHGAVDAASAARIEAVVRALDPRLTVLAPARDWNMTRLDTIAYARKRRIVVPATPASADENIWGRQVTGPATDVWDEPPEEWFTLTQPAAACPGEPAYLEIAFERGLPTAVNGVQMPLVDLIDTVGMLAGSHGVGRLDVVGPRGREVAEAPAAVVLHLAHAQLSRLATAPPESADGAVRLKLFKGDVEVEV